MVQMHSMRLITLIHKYHQYHWNYNHTTFQNFPTIPIISILKYNYFSTTKLPKIFQKILKNSHINNDENQQAFKDPLHVPVGPITKARSKKIKKALNGLIQELWVDSNVGHSKLDPKEDEGVINLIQAIEG